MEDTLDIIEKPSLIQNISDISHHTDNNNDIKVLYDGPLGTLSIPLYFEGSCKLGSGTKWCTTWTKDMFDKYNSKGHLYIWKDNNTKMKGKYQFHFTTFQFRDDKDRPLDLELVSSYRNNHPVLSHLFKQEEKDMTSKWDLWIVLYMLIELSKIDG